MSETKINVADLRIGMYVMRLDRDWLDTPFIMQGFLIEEREDVDIVAEYCDHVWVETDLKKISDLKNSGVGTASQARARQDIFADFAEEHKRVSKQFEFARSSVKDLFDSVKLGQAINVEESRQTVDNCVKSVLRNPDALMWMSKIREERQYTAEHSLNVCILSVAFGRQLGLSQEDLQKLGLCGLLHDVGKVRVPVEILNKKERLTPRERSMMRSHTVHGRNLLMATKNIFEGAIDVAYSHHERIDGTGYPRKLSVEKISYFTRIVAIADAYDAMTADRCYSRSMSSTEAIKIIYNLRGRQFDEQLATKFIESVGLYPPGSIVEFYNGQVGVVLETNQHLKHLPRAILLLNENKDPLLKKHVVDLSKIASGEMSKQFLIKQVWNNGSFGIDLRQLQEEGLHLKF